MQDFDTSNFSLALPHTINSTLFSFRKLKYWSTGLKIFLFYFVTVILYLQHKYENVN